MDTTTVAVDMVVGVMAANMMVMEGRTQGAQNGVERQHAGH